jgi:hypothetical protein
MDYAFRGGHAMKVKAERRLFIRTLGLVLLLLACTGLTAWAETPMISVDPTACVPMEDNGVIFGRVTPEMGGTTVRLYFRWREHGTFYYVEMNPAGAGKYWGVLPKPEKSTAKVERYVSVVDTDGRELGRSASLEIPVTSDCKVDLTPKQQGQAENLVIGETALPQKGRDVLGFLCDGIVSRIDANGILRVDEICRTCVVAWLNKRAVLLPIAGISSVVITHDRPEPSPSRP